MEDSFDRELANELAITLSGAADWRGSPDVMWRRVKSGLAKPQPLCRRFHPAAAAAAALLVLALSLGVYYTVRVAPERRALPGYEGDDVTWEGIVPLPQTPPGEEEPGGKRPAPLLFADFDIVLTKERYGPGDKVNLEVVIKAGDRDVTFAPGSPLLRLWHISLDPDNIVPIPLAGETELAIAAGERVVLPVSFIAGQPGWYRLEVIYQVGEGEGSMGGGAFFVLYPPGSTRTGLLRPNDADVTLDGHTVTVIEIDMSDSNTVVRFAVTNVPAPTGFQVRLETGCGRLIPEMGLSYRQSASGITAEAIFAPVPADAEFLLFGVTGLDKVVHGEMLSSDGPWIVEIPLEL